jgi:transcriptional regulator with XRE-family HTH domain
MTKTLVEQYVENPAHMRLYQQERAIYEVTELLESLMKTSGVSRAELAKRLGKSRGWITQLLDGESNKTIRTVADAFAVLGHEYRSFYQPIQISRKPTNYTVSFDEGSATRQVYPGPEGIRIKSLGKVNTPTLPEKSVQAVA